MAEVVQEVSYTGDHPLLGQVSLVQAFGKQFRLFLPIFKDFSKTFPKMRGLASKGWISTGSRPKG